jgi:hypothetical protein
MRVIVDGDSSKVYRKGDAVTGRVILVVEEAVKISSLRMVFAGNCVTKTSRPFHVNGGENSPLRREFEEKLRLFDQEKQILPESTLSPKKYTWAFEFTFPESTNPCFARITRGANYLKDPHPLPPTFQLKTNVPCGAAQISYFVQARLIFGGSRGLKRCRVVLPYHPTPQTVLPREAKCTSAVLYGQSWKPRETGDDTSRSVNRVLSKVARRTRTPSTPRIIPSIIYPETVAPGQHIPISLILRNTKDASNSARTSCTIDSLSITISTYSTSLCGHSITHPEDVVSKHVTCIARTAMNEPIPFNTQTPLTSNFRLVNDIECVPTFKSYTITRRYMLSVSIGVKFNDEHFVVKSTTPLEIVPRVPRSAMPMPEESEEVEALPVYTPREPSKEFAPDYEVVCGLERWESGSASDLRPVVSRGSSYASDASGRSMGASTPGSEIEELNFGVGRVAVRN